MQCPKCSAEMQDDGVNAWCVQAECSFAGYATVKSKAPDFSKHRDVAKIGPPLGLSAEFVRGYLAEECRDAGGQKVWAERNGVSAAYVCDVLQGRREPGDSICAGLGLRRVVMYVYDHERAMTKEKNSAT
jgi:hypothetical protein